MINWKKCNVFVDDFQILRCGIVDQVVLQDLGDGLFLMWCFMSFVNLVIECCYGVDDVVIRVFYDVCVDLGVLVLVVEFCRDLLVDMMYDVFNENVYG